MCFHRLLVIIPTEMNQMIQFDGYFSIGSTDHVISATDFGVNVTGRKMFSDHTVSLRPDINCGRAPPGLQACSKTNI